KKDRQKFVYPLPQHLTKNQEYLFCEDCLMQDHDVVISEKPEKCPICGSKNIRMIYHKNA
ncbi:hypothetical protein, partial [Megamonas funiformis]|uniref:hypothetical protein n=1 Tax=Megamonas funiformis TaxID=437897 RepID=UPI003991F169